MMRYSIVYTSRTGNTALLAEKVRACLPQEQVVYFGAPAPAGGEAELIFAGFWTDKGSCDEEMAEFLGGLREKKIVLFGTAGFGGDPDYFAQILEEVTEEIDESNTLLSSYMCQGKMQESVRARYEAMRADDPARAELLLDHFAKAKSHPDEADLAGLARVVERVRENYQS